MSPSSARESESSSSSWPQAIKAGGFSPPEVADLSALGRSARTAVPELLALLCEEQHAVEISSNLYLDADVERDLRRRVGERLSGGATLTMSELRELLGTTRKYSVPIGEYLDRIGLTRRDGDVRRLNRPIESSFGIRPRRPSTTPSTGL